MGCESTPYHDHVHSGLMRRSRLDTCPGVLRSSWKHDGQPAGKQFGGNRGNARYNPAYFAAYEGPRLRYLPTLVIAAVLAGCGQTPEGARKELANLGFTYSTASFVTAATRGDTHAVDLFLRAGMEVNASDRTSRTAMHGAAYSGNVETIQRLLEAGADINRIGGRARFTPLRVAIVQGNDDAAAAIKAAGGVEWLD